MIRHTATLTCDRCRVLCVGEPRPKYREAGAQVRLMARGLDWWVDMHGQALCPKCHRDLDGIVAAVVTFFDLPESTLLSRQRTAHVAWARQVGMYLCRLAGGSFPRVARRFGRDHGTAQQACRRVRDALDTEPDRARQVKDLLQLTGLREDVAS